jgi:CMP-N-acetylneuraminic acid synthetase
MSDVVGIMIAKGESKRLPKKNKREISGKKMFHWNLLKMVELFEDNVYVSSDDKVILDEAGQLGAYQIRRPDQLVGHEVPSVPIFQHVIRSIDQKPDNIVHVQANSPTCPLEVIKVSTDAINYTNADELITVYPGNHDVNGSVWAFSYERLMDYGDYRDLNTDILVSDDSIDIHYKEDLETARGSFSLPSFL